MNEIYMKFDSFDLLEKNVTNLDIYYPINNVLLDKNKNFRFSQVVQSMMDYYHNNPSLNETMIFQNINNVSEQGYIIPVGVTYRPEDWTDAKQEKSIFELLHTTFLKDLKNGKAILLIDQSVEGYTTDWLWDWFHKKCEEHNISPNAIIYVTGDQACQDSYSEWCKIHSITSKLRVIPSLVLSWYIKKYYDANLKTTNFNNLLQYKKENAKKIYLYDCLNKRPRLHRIINYLHLVSADMLNKGLVSMSAPSTWDIYMQDRTKIVLDYRLPKNIFDKIDFAAGPQKINISEHSSQEIPYHLFVERIRDDVYKNSWVSVVTESSYFKDQKNVFISEKTFKPIACMQPFIIVGSRHSLMYLRRLGYKTFHPLIDESYDDFEDTERFLAIINSIKKIEQIEDKLIWYEEMKDILMHNLNLFNQIGKGKSVEHNLITKYYFNYFNNIK